MNAAATGAMPDWLVERLIDNGFLDRPTGVTRRARAVACDRGCGQPVMRGFDEDFGGCVVECDPRPLTQAGEIEAIIAGRRTYELSGIHYLTLWSRNKWRIKARPVGTPRMEVLAQHKCNSTEQFEWCDRPPLSNQPLPDEPPF